MNNSYEVHVVDSDTLSITAFAVLSTAITFAEQHKLLGERVRLHAYVDGMHQQLM